MTSLSSISAIVELQKSRKSKEPIKYVSPTHPFVKSERESQTPFHYGFRKNFIETKPFCTFSQYSGEINALGFAGKGIYRYPHGVVYEGDFRDGQFHGDGVLIYPQGQRVEGTWFKGKLVRTVYKIVGTSHVEFKPDEFLTFPQRAQAFEMDDNDVVNCTEEELGKPKHDIPENCYDTGDGYFDAVEYVIYSYDGAVKRIPTDNEIEMMKKKFRENADITVGYLPDIYEYWISGRSKEISTIKENIQKCNAEIHSEVAEEDTSVYYCNFLDI